MMKMYDFLLAVPISNNQFSAVLVRLSALQSTSTIKLLDGLLPNDPRRSDCRISTEGQPITKFTPSSSHRNMTFPMLLLHL